MSRPARNYVRILDPAKVRQARIRQGWAEYTLSNALGVSTRVIDRIEHGQDQCYLSLLFVRDLASTLGVSVAELILDTAQDPTADTPDDTISSDDVRTVGALLSCQIAAVAVDALADTLHWTIERTLIALHELEDLLPPAGQRLVWLLDTHVQISPADHHQAAAGLSRRNLYDRGIDQAQARLIARLATIGPAHRLGDIDRLSLRELEQSGLVETGVLPGGRPIGNRTAEGARLTDAARFNLVLANDT